MNTLRCALLGLYLLQIASAAPVVNVNTDPAYIPYQRDFVGVNFGVELSPTAKPPMKLHMMPDKGLKGMGAVCLDGTDAGFYFSAATDPKNKNDWQLYFQGGGWCYDEVDCLGRSHGGLGSSKDWAPTSSIGGIMSDNCTVNPDFCNFNRVHMVYCDGNSFSGNRDDAVMVCNAHC